MQIPLVDPVSLFHAPSIESFQGLNETMARYVPRVCFISFGGTAQLDMWRSRVGELLKVL